MAVAAPNFSLGGLQASEMRKPRPNSRNAGHAPINSAIATPARRTRTRTAEPSVKRRNPASDTFSRPSARARSMGELCAPLGVSIAVAVMDFFNISRAEHAGNEDGASSSAAHPGVGSLLLDVGVPHLLDQRLHIGGHGDVVEILRHLVALVISPF